MPVNLFKKYGINPDQNQPPTRQPVDLLKAKPQPVNLFKEYGINPDEKIQPDRDSVLDEITRDFSDPTINRINRYVRQPLLNTLGGATNFIEQAPLTIANAISQHLAGKNILPQKAPANPYVNANSASYKLGNFLAPFLIPGLGEEIGLSRAAASAELPKAVQLGAKAADLGATNAAAGAVIGAGQGNNDIGQSALMGALIGAPLQGALGQIPSAIGSAIKKYRTPEAVNRAKALGETPANFFDVVDDPRRGRSTSGVLRNMPFVSRVAAKEDQLLNKTYDKANNFISNLKGDLDDKEVAPTLVEAIQKNKVKKTKKYNDLFKEILNQAAEKGHTISYDDTINTLQRIRQNEHGDEAEQGLAMPGLGKRRLTDWINYFKNVSPKNKLADESKSPLIAEPQDRGTDEGNFNANDSSNNTNNKKQTFARAHINQSDFNFKADEAAKFGKLGKPRLAALYHKIHSSILNDIGRSLKDNDDEDLYNRFQSAREGFKNEVVPYRDRTIKDLINEELNPEQAVNVLAKDKHAAVLNDLSNESRNLLGYLKLENKFRSDEQNNPAINPVSLANAYAKMAPRMRNKFYTPAQQKELNDLQVFTNVGKEAKGMRQIPLTGARTQQQNLKDKLEYALGIGGTYLGTQSPHLVIPAIASALGASKLAENALYSPRLRRQLLGIEPATIIKRLFEQEPKLRKSVLYGATGENDNGR